MYMIPSMVELGLKEGEKFTSDAHRDVAINICIGNSNITDRDLLTACVTIINKVPMDKIKLVSYMELVKDYNFPDILF